MTETPSICVQEQGQISERTHPFGTLLEVTENGLFTLESFDQRIPASKRDQIDRVCDIWRGLFITEQQTLAESFPLSDGGLCVRLRLLEGETALVDLLITLPDVTSITLLPQRWRSSAPEIYAVLSQALGSGYSETAAIPDDLPAGVTMQQVNDREWLLSLAASQDAMQAMLMLTLPEEGLARHYASRWEASKDLFLDKLRLMLTADI